MQHDVLNHQEILAEIKAASPNLPPGCAADIPKGRADIPIGLRLFEIATATAMLTVGLPVMAIMALIIKLETPGPALFHQPRLGVNGRLFQFVKFRTLYHDARQRFPKLYEYKYSDDEIKTFRFKSDGDPRVTKQGRWMRRSSLDELPNLFLVLSGDLALVGPRPQIPEMLPYYKGVMLERFSVRPGLTDLAHVSGRSNLSFYETVAMDVAYVRNRSWKLDLSILWKTFLVVLRREGAF